MANRPISNRLEFRLDDAGIHIPIPLISSSSDQMTIKVYGPKIGKNGRTGTYVWVEAQVSRNQVVGLANALWAVVDSEQEKVNRMKNAMKREA